MTKMISNGIKSGKYEKVLIRNPDGSYSIQTVRAEKVKKDIKGIKNNIDDLIAKYQNKGLVKL